MTLEEKCHFEQEINNKKYCKLKFIKESNMQGYLDCWQYLCDGYKTCDYYKSQQKLGFN